MSQLIEIKNLDNLDIQSIYLNFGVFLELGAKLEQFRPLSFLQDKASGTSETDLHKFVYGSHPDSF